MAEATLTGPTYAFTWPNWRTQRSNDTFGRDDSPREVTKDELRRDMVDVYRAYRRFRKEAAPSLEDLTTNVAAGGDAAFQAMMLGMDSAIQRFDPKVAKFELVHDMLTNWLVGSFREYEARWLGQLPSGLVEAIEDIKALGAKWDGRSAAPVSSHAIDAARKLLLQVKDHAEAFEPFADPEGSLGLEAHHDSKSLYILSTPRGDFTYVLRDGETVHRGSKVDLNDMSRIISAFF